MDAKELSVPRAGGRELLLQRGSERPDGGQPGGASIRCREGALMRQLT